MRALRVVGLHEDGKSIVCEDPARRERFLLPADERLRAAARGDITRLGQIEIELESQMRPREIQARIRAGESVEQVAGSAGVPMQRVERFAYPVLLERSRTAELAQQAHPVREDGPDVRTLGEVVAYAFGVRGQDYTQATWDSWRGDDGKWVVALHWQAGRSDNQAHWSFSPGAHGGTVTVLDEHAEDLLDPNAHRAPRTLRAVDGREAGELEQPTLDSAYDEPPVNVVETPAREPADDDTTEIPRIPAEEPEQTKAAPPKPPARPAKGKKNHPVVPAWEDVLLGVRSQRG
ncbi:septation protein SepH [Amycolatopsis nigrescens]|uniref:septation protein SepH n=1 Tax=Amycolatopsis nigrescens TaxID=381445 RepID=UPI00039FAA62|nr:septation protein SepH [Amycolatopsis nigrescens]